MGVKRPVPRAERTCLAPLSAQSLASLCFLFKCRPRFFRPQLPNGKPTRPSLPLWTGK